MALPTRVSRSVDLPFEQLRDFDNLLNRFWGARGDQSGGNGMNLAPYAVDVREDADHIYVDAELPGFRKDEVDITLENSTLTIQAERKEQRQEGNADKGDYLLNERRYTRFARSFTLPPTVNDQTCEAKLSDGVLHITLSKREESKPRKVKVG